MYAFWIWRGIHTTSFRFSKTSDFKKDKKKKRLKTNLVVLEDRTKTRE